MKILKASVAIATIFASTFAHAGDYKWVSLTGEQMQNIKKTCQQAIDDSTQEMKTLAVISGGFGVMSTHIADGELLAQAGTTVAVAGALATIGLKAYADNFTTPELQALVMEQQAQAPGLMTEKLRQVAAENNYDVSKMLAALNLLAIDNKICARYSPEMKSLGATQDAERKEEARRLRDEMAAKAQMEKEAQQAQVVDQVK